MARIELVCSGADKQLWVQAARDERVSLSEFLRRAAMARIGASRVYEYAKQEGLVGGFTSSRDWSLRVEPKISTVVGKKAEDSAFDKDTETPLFDENQGKPLQTTETKDPPSGSTKTGSSITAKTSVETPIQAALRRARKATDGET